MKITINVLIFEANSPNLYHEKYIKEQQGDHEG